MPADVPWDEGLRRFARALRATLMAHPGVLPLMLTQSGATPRNLDRAEAVLSTLSEAGFSLAHAVAVVNAVILFTTAYTVSTAPGSRNASPGKGSVTEVAAYPLIARATIESAATGGSFEVTIDAILTGFGALRAQ